MDYNFIQLVNRDHDVFYAEMLSGYTCWTLPPGTLIQSVRHITHLDNNVPYYENLSNNEVSWGLPENEMTPDSVAIVNSVQNMTRSELEAALEVSFDEPASHAQTAILDAYVEALANGGTAVESSVQESQTLATENEGFYSPPISSTAYPIPELSNSLLLPPAPSSPPPMPSGPPAVPVFSNQNVSSEEDDAPMISHKPFASVNPAAATNSTNNKAKRANVVSAAFPQEEESESEEQEMGEKVVVVEDDEVSLPYSAFATQLKTIDSMKKTVIKSGMLQKLAKVSGRNWKRRFFILNPYHLAYYESEVLAIGPKAKPPKGEIQITSDSTIEIDNTVDKKHGVGFVLTNSWESMTIAASSIAERADWMQSIQTIINYSKSYHKEYLSLIKTIVKKSTFSSKETTSVTSVTKYFILSNGLITYHPGHKTTSEIEGLMNLNRSTVIDELNDVRFLITLIDSDADNTKITFSFTNNSINDAKQYKIWRDFILKCCGKTLDNYKQVAKVPVVETIISEKIAEEESKETTKSTAPTVVSSPAKSALPVGTATTNAWLLNVSDDSGDDAPAAPKPAVPDTLKTIQSQAESVIATENKVKTTENKAKTATRRGSVVTQVETAAAGETLVLLPPQAPPPVPPAMRLHSTTAPAVQNPTVATTKTNNSRPKSTPATVATTNKSKTTIKNNNINADKNNSDDDQHNIALNNNTINDNKPRESLIYTEVDFDEYHAQLQAERAKNSEDNIQLKTQPLHQEQLQQQQAVTSGVFGLSLEAEDDDGDDESEDKNHPFQGETERFSLSAQSKNTGGVLLGKMFQDAKNKPLVRVVFDSYCDVKTHTINATSLLHLCYEFGVYYNMTKAQKNVDSYSSVKSSSGIAVLNYDNFMVWWRSNEQFSTMKLADPKVQRRHHAATLFKSYDIELEGCVDIADFNSIHKQLIETKLISKSTEFLESLQRLGANNSGIVNFNVYMAWIDSLDLTGQGTKSTIKRLFNLSRSNSANNSVTSNNSGSGGGSNSNKNKPNNKNNKTAAATAPQESKRTSPLSLIQPPNNYNQNHNIVFSTAPPVPPVPPVPSHAYGSPIAAHVTPNNEFIPLSNSTHTNTNRNSAEYDSDCDVISALTGNTDAEEYNTHHRQYDSFSNYNPAEHENNEYNNAYNSNNEYNSQYNSPINSPSQQNNHNNNNSISNKPVSEMNAIERAQWRKSQRQSPNSTPGTGKSPMNSPLHSQMHKKFFDSQPEQATPPTPAPPRQQQQQTRQHHAYSLDDELAGVTIEDTPFSYGAGNSGNNGNNSGNVFGAGTGVFGMSADYSDEDDYVPPVAPKQAALASGVVVQPMAPTAPSAIITPFKKSYTSVSDIMNAKKAELFAKKSTSGESGDGKSSFTAASSSVRTTPPVVTASKAKLKFRGALSKLNAARNARTNNTNESDSVSEPPGEMSLTVEEIVQPVPPPPPPPLVSRGDNDFVNPLSRLSAQKTTNTATVATSAITSTTSAVQSQGVSWGNNIEFSDTASNSNINNSSNNIQNISQKSSGFVNPLSNKPPPPGLNGGSGSTANSVPKPPPPSNNVPPPPVTNNMTITTPNRNNNNNNSNNNNSNNSNSQSAAFSPMRSKPASLLQQHAGQHTIRSNIDFALDTKNILSETESRISNYAGHNNNNSNNNNNNNSGGNNKFSSNNSVGSNTSGALYSHLVSHKNNQQNNNIIGNNNNNSNIAGNNSNNSSKNNNNNSSALPSPDKNVQLVTYQLLLKERHAITKALKDLHHAEEISLQRIANEETSSANRIAEAQQKSYHDISEAERLLKQHVYEFNQKITTETAQLERLKRQYEREKLVADTQHKQRVAEVTAIATELSKHHSALMSERHILLKQRYALEMTLQSINDVTGGGGYGNSTIYSGDDLYSHAPSQYSNSYNNHNNYNSIHNSTQNSMHNNYPNNQYNQQNYSQQYPHNIQHNSNNSINSTNYPYAYNNNNNSNSSNYNSNNMQQRDSSHSEEQFPLHEVRGSGRTRTPSPQRATVFSHTNNSHINNNNNGHNNRSNSRGATAGKGHSNNRLESRDLSTSNSVIATSTTNAAAGLTINTATTNTVTQQAQQSSFPNSNPPVATVMSLTAMLRKHRSDVSALGGSRDVSPLSAARFNNIVVTKNGVSKKVVKPFR